MTLQNIHTDRILILDFGSQYSQLIARRIREAGVYCELYAWDVSDNDIKAFKPKGIILSGGPETTTGGHLLWHANHDGAIRRKSGKCRPS